MLVLTRKAQQRIQIGDNITISIIKVKGNSVRVGIEAPMEVRIVRAELPSFAAEGERVAAADELDELEAAVSEPSEPSEAGQAGQATSSGLSGLVNARRSRLGGCAPLPV